MRKRKASERDPMDAIFEEAFEPGDYISSYEAGGFAQKLSEVERQLFQIAGVDAERALTLYETFLAACIAKAEEIDDSDCYFADFVCQTFGSWIKVRQAAGADRAETASLLLRQMDQDEYGLTNDLDRAAAKALDAQGLAAFEAAVLARFDSSRLQWGSVLRAIYFERGEIEKYIDVSERAGFSSADYAVICTLLQAKGEFEKALSWAERGLRVEPMYNSGFERGFSYDLTELRRSLLKQLGRHAEALHSAWANFQERPSADAYIVLRDYAPEEEFQAWHEKAMAAAASSDLGTYIQLCVEAQAISALAVRMDRETDGNLEKLGHYAGEPAAKCLREDYPGLAARMYTAISLRILNARQSKYYSEALAHLECARLCFERAGLQERWVALAAKVMKDHSRKHSFQPRFKRIVFGEPLAVKSAFRNWIDRSKG